MKKYHVIYLILLLFVLAGSAVFGCLCFRYNRLPEGCIIIGGVILILTFSYMLHVNSLVADKKMMIDAAGFPMVSIDCVCKLNGERTGSICMLEFHKYGVLIDSEDIPYDLIEYPEIDYEIPDDFHIRLHCLIDGTDYMFLFITNSLIKVKAARQILEQNVGMMKRL